MAKSAPKSRNDLQDNTKAASIEVLQACLTDSIDLYNTTRQAHWNVKGPNFHGLHLMFETFYGTLEGDIDLLAERLVQLGGTAIGASQNVASKTRLAAYPADLKAGADHVTALMDRYAALAKSVREGIDETDEAGDADTADILTNVSKNLDKALWMLEATATN
ncbi:DNA starvation/stationary phase protection protein Dps [Falsiroseomonas tokyonensis]|uniref:DNA starvation/stationary phase protection protein Dps n=1 Tax=Falsiroseomonas tokyonensis TaxID=430521 RepID=A0ABV7BXH4_9PROT|nr:DNA starvation/stationary phase protection protein Dps [Falsiroseomonas tokyonensis]MBU8539574.1 DNA starvation/stationary phase protection protein Dps [Falsiroseomonas tokyonensis]